MACGVAADQDDDGNAATKNSTGRKPQSVAKIVIEETGMVVDQNKRTQYSTALINCVKSQDDAGVNELIEELNGYKDDDAMKTCVWDDLPSHVKSYITKLTGGKQ